MGVKLRSAPVYFVLAQIQFNPILALDSYVSQIQDELRKGGYPDIEEVRVKQVNLAFAGESLSGAQSAIAELKQYNFHNIERTESFVLSSDRLSFQTTHYEVFDSLLAKFQQGLEIVHKCIALNFIARVGLRYLDAVKPNNGEHLSLFIDAQLLGLTTKNLGAIAHSFSETVYINRDVNVTARALTINGKLGIPPDLQPMSLNLMERFKSIEGIHAVLDIDGSIAKRSSFNIMTAKDYLTRIHDDVTKAFHAAITPAALAAWS